MSMHDTSLKHYCYVCMLSLHKTTACCMIIISILQSSYQILTLHFHDTFNILWTKYSLILMPALINSPTHLLIFRTIIIMTLHGYFIIQIMSDKLENHLSKIILRTSQRTGKFVERYFLGLLLGYVGLFHHLSIFDLSSV